jgi:two-component system cell cycle response regulator DivK
MANILVIEDNELNLKLMKDILVSQGYNVETAEDGKAGLDKAENNDYDLILLDIQMPVFSGYDFLQTYKKNTPVIVVSACAMETEINKAKELGCKDYISKPIKINEFLTTIKNYTSQI